MLTIRSDLVSLVPTVSVLAVFFQSSCLLSCILVSLLNGLGSIPLFLSVHTAWWSICSLSRGWVSEQRLDQDVVGNTLENWRKPWSVLLLLCQPLFEQTGRGNSALKSCQLGQMDGFLESQRGEATMAWTWQRAFGRGPGENLKATVGSSRPPTSVTQISLLPRFS